MSTVGPPHLRTEAGDVQYIFSRVYPAEQGTGQLKHLARHLAGTVNVITPQLSSHFRLPELQVGVKFDPGPSFMEHFNFPNSLTDRDQNQYGIVNPYFLVLGPSQTFNAASYASQTKRPAGSPPYSPSSSNSTGPSTFSLPFPFVPLLFSSVFGGG